MNGFEKARREARLSQIKAAELVGITQPTISEYENGTIMPSVPTLIILCEVYRTTPNVLLGFDGDGTPLGLSPKAIKMARRWEQLTEDGQDRVSSTIIEEERIGELPKTPVRMPQPVSSTSSS